MGFSVLDLLVVFRSSISGRERCLTLCSPLVSLVWRFFSDGYLEVISGKSVDLLRIYSLSSKLTIVMEVDDVGFFRFGDFLMGLMFPSLILFDGMLESIVPHVVIRVADYFPNFIPQEQTKAVLVAGNGLVHLLFDVLLQRHIGRHLRVEAGEWKDYKLCLRAMVNTQFDGEGAGCLYIFKAVIEFSTVGEQSMVDDVHHVFGEMPHRDVKEKVSEQGKWWNPIWLAASGGIPFGLTVFVDKMGFFFKSLELTTSYGRFGVMLWVFVPDEYFSVRDIPILEGFLKTRFLIMFLSEMKESSPDSIYLDIFVNLLVEDNAEGYPRFQKVRPKILGYMECALHKNVESAFENPLDISLCRIFGFMQVRSAYKIMLYKRVAVLKNRYVMERRSSFLGNLLNARQDVVGSLVRNDFESNVVLATCLTIDLQIVETIRKGKSECCALKRIISGLDFDSKHIKCIGMWKVLKGDVQENNSCGWESPIDAPNWLDIGDIYQPHVKVIDRGEDVGDEDPLQQGKNIVAFGFGPLRALICM